MNRREFLINTGLVLSTIHVSSAFAGGVEQPPFFMFELDSSVVNDLILGEQYRVNMLNRSLLHDKVQTLDRSYMVEHNGHAYYRAMAYRPLIKARDDVENTYRCTGGITQMHVANTIVFVDKGNMASKLVKSRFNLNTVEESLDLVFTTPIVEQLLTRPIYGTV